MRRHRKKPPADIQARTFGDTWGAAWPLNGKEFAPAPVGRRAFVFALLVQGAFVRDDPLVEIAMDVGAWADSQKIDRSIRGQHGAVADWDKAVGAFPDWNTDSREPGEGFEDSAAQHKKTVPWVGLGAVVHGKPDGADIVRRNWLGKAYF